jgi:hypothetical protein
MLGLSLSGAAFRLTQRTRSAEITGAQPTPRRMQVRISIKPQKKLFVKRSHKANLFFFALEARYKYPISKPVYAPQVAKSKGFTINESSLIFSPNLQQFSVLINNLEIEFIIPDTKPNSQEKHQNYCSDANSLSYYRDRVKELIKEPDLTKR